MPWANVDGEPILKCRVTIPYYGAWVADVACSVDTSFASAVTLTLGDLSLVGTSFRVDDFAGQRAARLVGGRLGLRKQIARRMYRNDGGVMLSLVLRDLAADTGETFVLAKDTSIGTAYVREFGPASRVLRQLSPTWWVANDGSVHVGPRPTGTITSPFDVIEYDGARGLVRIATEHLADWTPGLSFTSPTLNQTLTIGSVTHTMTNEGEARLEVLPFDAGTPTDVLFRGFDSLVREDSPRQTFGGVYEYAVQSTVGGVHVVPLDTTIGLPNIVAPLQGLMGGSVKVSGGQECLVVFLNEDPTKPRILGGGTVDEIDLGDALDTVIRANDRVTLGTTTGVIVLANTGGRRDSRVKA